MNNLRELEDMLYEELEKFTERRSVSQGSLDAIEKLTTSIKNIKKIEMCDGGKGWSRDEGASYRGYGSYSYGDDSYMGYSDRRYSRADGVADKLKEMLDKRDTTPEEKATIRKAMQILNK